MKQLIERMGEQYRQHEANRVQRAADVIETLTAERDAAFAMSRCETDEACANLARLTAEVAKWKRGHDIFEKAFKDGYDENVKLIAEHAALLKFAKSILDDWPDVGPYDCGDIQSLAVDAGLLIGVEAKKPCGEDCNCREYEDLKENGDFEYPVMCYHKVDFLKGMP